MIATAFLIGLAGSLHCAGMCSPLVVAVTSIKGPFLRNRLVYNLGRILSYGILGAMVVAFGSSTGFGDLQHLLSAGLGILLIFLGIAGVSHIQIPYVSPLFQRMAGALKTVFAKQLQSKSMGSILLLGGINGLLPCGLTYIALAYCLGLSDGFQGFAFMVAFGAGTLPVMLGVTTLVQALTARMNIQFQRFAAITMILLGSLLIFRAGYEHSHEPVSESGMGLEVICR